MVRCVNVWHVYQALDIYYRPTSENQQGSTYLLLGQLPKLECWQKGDGWSNEETVWNKQDITGESIDTVVWQSTRYIKILVAFILYLVPFLSLKADWSGLWIRKYVVSKDHFWLTRCIPGYRQGSDVDFLAPLGVPHHTYRKVDKDEYVSMIVFTSSHEPNFMIHRWNGLTTLFYSACASWSLEKQMYKFKAISPWLIVELGYKTIGLLQTIHRKVFIENPCPICIIIQHHICKLIYHQNPP